MFTLLRGGMHQLTLQSAGPQGLLPDRSGHIPFQADSTPKSPLPPKWGSLTCQGFLFPMSLVAVGRLEDRRKLPKWSQGSMARGGGPSCSRLMHSS